METKDVNFVRESATKNLLEKYKSNNLITYNLSISILKMLQENGILSDEDYASATAIITSNHDLNNTSIFVSN